MAELTNKKEDAFGAATQEDALYNLNENNGNTKKIKNQEKLSINEMSLSEAAEHYAHLGYKVFPLKPRGKEPLGELVQHGCKDASSDVDTIKKWWKAYPEANIGFVTGKTNRCFVIDIDGSTGKEELRKIKKDREWPKTIIAKSGRDGGGHFYFRYPEEIEMVKNRAGVLPNVDIRGDGGYIVVPPSIHPNGKKYSWKRDFCPQEMECASEWILQEIVHGGQKKNGSEKAFEIKTHPYFSREFSNTLEKIRTCPEGKRNDTLYRGAFKLAQMCHGRYLQESVVKENLTDAARICGLSDDETKKTVESAFKEALSTPGDYSFLKKGDDEFSKIYDESEIEWEPPLLTASISTPEIEEASIPCKLQPVVSNICQNLEVSRGMVYLTALGMLAAAVQGKFEVRLTDTFSVPCNLYFLAFSAPGTRKSPVLSILSRPIYEWEKSQKEVWLPKIRKQELEASLIQEKLADLRKQAKQAQYPDAIIDEMMTLEATAQKIDVVPKIILNDTTPESLLAFLNDHNGQCAIISDEGSIFDVLGGLYTNNIANIDVLLKGWDKGNISMKRRECEINLEPLLTFCVLAQPAVLNKISAKKSFSGFGLLERFLMWYPQSNIGYRTHNGMPIQEDIINEYNKFIKSFLDVPMGEAPQVLSLSPDGYGAIVKCVQRLERHLAVDGKYHKIATWSCKMSAQLGRLSGLLHLAEGWTGKTISLDTVRRAINLYKLLLKHALKAYNEAKFDEDDKILEELIEWVLLQERGFFFKKDLTYAFKDKIKVDKIDKMLRNLISRNIISRPLAIGHKTLKYFVHPDLLKKDEDDKENKI